MKRSGLILVTLLSLILPSLAADDLASLKAKAERGDAAAQYSLGFMYANGGGVTQDKAEAVKWYRKASEQGNAEAQYSLGSMYVNGEGAPQDKNEHDKDCEICNEAFKKYYEHFTIDKMLQDEMPPWTMLEPPFTILLQRQPIDNGGPQDLNWYPINPWASDEISGATTGYSQYPQVKEGTSTQNSNSLICIEENFPKVGIYEGTQGIQLKQKPAYRASWHVLAIERASRKVVSSIFFRGPEPKQTILSTESNIGQPPSPKVLIDWLQPTTFPESMKWLRKAAKAGFPVAMYKIGNLFYSGSGVTKDYAEALKWYRKAADAGSPVGINSVGRLFQEGKGVAKDYTEALKWYRKAADAGNADGMFHVGLFFQDGLGVAKDYTEALKWFRKAADAGSADGMNNVGWFFQNGLGVAKDYTEALKWFRKAVDAGSATGMNNIGWLYENGLGVAKDYAEALKWYRKAAATGFQEAKDYLQSHGEKFP